METSESLHVARVSAQGTSAPSDNSREAGPLTLSFAGLMSVADKARPEGSLGTYGSW